MATDFTYGNKTIVTSGAIRPSEKNTPTDARCRVATKADMESIPLPAVGLLVYVEDEQKFYVVGGLKANSMGVANMQVDMSRVFPLVTSTGGEGSGGGSSTGGTIDEATVKRLCAEYHTENTFTKTIQASELTDANSDGIYEATINHNLNTTAFNIAILDANNQAVYECFDVVDANNIKIYNDKAEELKVTIRK